RVLGSGRALRHQRLGHAREPFSAAEELSAPGLRPDLSRSHSRSRRARPAGRHTRRLPQRTRPHAEDQQCAGRRPRSLVARLLGRAGGRRYRARQGHRSQRSDRRRRGKHARFTQGHSGDDVPSARHRSAHADDRPPQPAAADRRHGGRSPRVVLKLLGGIPHFMKPPSLRSLFGALVWASACLIGIRTLLADDWPHWRGPQRSDVVAERSGYRAGDWPIGEAVWSADVGQGASSPLVVGGRVFAQGWRDGRESIVCLDAATGRELWKQSYKCPKYGRRATGDEGLYSGPSSTPEYDATTKRLFTLSVDGDLNCWEAERGRHLWELNLYDQYDVPRRPRHGRSGLRDYGYTTSPLVHRDWVIVEVGDDEGTLMGFDVRDGRRVWTSECRDPAGHTGRPAPITVEGVPCLAAMTYEGLLVARLDAGHEGRTVARYPWSTDFANNIASPAVEGNSVLITSSYNRHAICRLDVTLQGANKVWEQPLASKVCSPVIYDGHVYWAWQQVHCLDFATGAERFSGGSFGDAGSCIVTGDAKL